MSQAAISNPVEKLLRAHIRDARQAIATAVARVDALEKLTETVSDLPQAGRRVRVSDGWTSEEDALLFEHYAKLGAAELHRTLMSHRTVLALRSRAKRLGLVFLPAAQRLRCDQCQAMVKRNQIAACSSKFCEGKKIVAAEKRQ